MRDLEITEATECFVVTPKRYLADEWASVNDAIKKLGGSWIRRANHWQIPK
jgi:hypothetical protein